MKNVVASLWSKKAETLSYLIFLENTNPTSFPFLLIISEYRSLLLEVCTGPFCDMVFTLGHWLTAKEVSLYLSLLADFLNALG